MKTALLVIDVQRIYTDSDSDLYCADSKATVKRINRLIDAFEGEGSPIFFIRHTHKRNGSDLGRMFDFSGEPEDNFNFKEGSPEIEYDSTLHVAKNAIHVTKNRYSAFTGTNLDSKLKKLGIHKVVICGFMTNFCCESTARSAHDRDYFVDFIVDATGTPGLDSMKEPEVREVVGEMLGAGFARVLSVTKYLKQ